MKTASIVIRTFNEERWIRHCLEKVFLQEMRDFDVIIVDNNSSDKTLDIVKRYPIKEIVSIDKYLPGKALNIGVNINKAEYYVFLSSHCIPVDKFWLSELIYDLQKDKLVAGCYGRQLPLPSSEDIDKRDLFMTFSCESRISQKDGFFHNANSAVRGTYFEQYQFDNESTNAEDHLWGQEVIKNGFKIAYKSNAAVYHHHGLHQGNAPKRVSGVLKQLERGISKDLVSFPISLTNKGAILYSIVIIPDYQKARTEELIIKFKSQIKEECSIKKIFFIIPRGLHGKQFKDNNFVKFFLRDSLKTSSEDDLLVLLKEIVSIIELKQPVPDHYIYLNSTYRHSNSNLIRELITSHIQSNNDSTHIGKQTYDCIWSFNQNDGYSPVAKDLLSPKTQRHPLYNVYYGLGSILTPQLIRNPDLSDNISGIFEIYDEDYTIRDRD